MASHFKAVDRTTGAELYIEADNEEDGTTLLQPDLISSEITSVTFQNKTTAVIRKMAEAEFQQAVKYQSMPKALKNPAGGEKWVTESLEHTRGFQNRGVTDPQVVAEFQVDKSGYRNIRDKAIPQQGSRAHQPATGKPYNIYNTERLGNKPNKINLGLKGAENVDQFNKFVVKVTKIDPDSFMNRSQITRWIRRNPLKSGAAVVGIAVDIATVTLSIIDDNGKFGESTQISLGEIGGGLIGAEIASVIGAQIGVILGSVIPVWGNIVLGMVGAFIGSLIGGGIVKLARYLFAIAPVAPGLGAPILDTDPYPTSHGVPSLGLNTDVYNTNNTPPGATGVPSMGLNTGAFGTPKSDYETRRN